MRRFRFSLKTLLLFYVLGGCGIAWLSHSYSEYLAEQKAIDSLSTKTAQKMVMTVTGNGKVTSRTGFLML